VENITGSSYIESIEEIQRAITV